MTTSAQLNDREQLILKAVVGVYIATAEPVGSRAVVKRYGLDLSPATVRNVMADLEEAGFLEQVHTSSGRIPTDRGYRYYVDYLMREHSLSIEERARIERDLSVPVSDAEEVMRHASRLLAAVSQQTGIVEAPDDNDAEVRRIELVWLAPMRAVVMIADNYGRVRTVMVNTEGMLSAADMPQVNRFLNDTLRGVAIHKLASVVHAQMRMVLDEHRRLAEQALSLLLRIPAHRTAQVFLDGATQLFEQPEFRDVAKAREVFNLLDERERLAGLLHTGAARAATYPPRPTVTIGSETHEFGLEEISVVASPYCVGEKTVGVLGVLGPRRMPYPRMTALVEFTAGMLSRMLTELAGQSTRGA